MQLVKCETCGGDQVELVLVDTRRETWQGKCSKCGAKGNGGDFYAAIHNWNDRQAAIVAAKVKEGVAE